MVQHGWMPVGGGVGGPTSTGPVQSVCVALGKDSKLNLQTRVAPDSLLSHSSPPNSDQPISALALPQPTSNLPAPLRNPFPPSPRSTPTSRFVYASSRLFAPWSRFPARYRLHTHEAQCRSALTDLLALQGCGDVLTKKKLDGHRNQCWNASYTCIDCMKHFQGTSYKAHTVRPSAPPAQPLTASETAVVKTAAPLLLLRLDHVATHCLHPPTSKDADVFPTPKVVHERGSKVPGQAV